MYFKPSRKKIIVSRPAIFPIGGGRFLTIFHLFSVVVDNDSRGHDIVKRRARNVYTHNLNKFLNLLK